MKTAFIIASTVVAITFKLVWIVLKMMGNMVLSVG